MFELTEALREELQSFDTPTVCNALEVLAPGRRGFGYTTEHLHCIRPQLKPVVAIARTATIRAAHPGGLSPADMRKLSDAYYAYIEAGPRPSIVCIQDIDEQRGYGSFWGEVNSNIHKGLGCIGTITNGGVRDVPDIAPGFQMLAGRVIPSHAFVHVVDFGHPVTVAGMNVRDGDLVHADQHGAVIVPQDVASRVKDAARQIQLRERAVIAAASAPGFTTEKLRAAQQKAAELH